MPLACRSDLISHDRVGGFLAARLTRLYSPFLISERHVEQPATPEPAPVAGEHSALA